MINRSVVIFMDGKNVVEPHGRKVRSFGVKKDDNDIKKM